MHGSRIAPAARDGEACGTCLAMSVTYERRGAVAVVTIERPERKNAVDRATARALADAFRRFEGEDDASVAVLTGAGGTFCAGADLKAIAEGQPNRVAPDGDGPMGPTRMMLDKPVIAAVEGFAVAGGLELALWCDLRVMAEDATFGVFCRRWGVPLIDGGTVRLPRLVGHSFALDLIITGREVRADEAQRIGLANRVCPPGEALATAITLAEQISALPQTCLRNDRRSSYDQWGHDEATALARETELGLATLSAPAFITGVRRFGERRRDD